MIRGLYIRDFAVIDELAIEFGPGMNILTGETGAGKSIIVGAANIALGERADAEVVRSGCDRAIVELVLDVSNSPPVLSFLESAGLFPDDGQIIITREIHKNGKSQCRINGRPVTVSFVKEVTDSLVDVHGQHEHQFLLRQDRHIGVLDAWCGGEVISLLGEVSSGYKHLCSLKNELAQLQTDERERARMIDLYKFQIEEISKAKLIPGEESDLEAERLKLANAEKLYAGVSEAYRLLGDRSGDFCVLDALGEAVMPLQELATIDSQLSKVVESLQSALYELEDISRELRNYRDSVEFSPERLAAVEERLDLIRTLKRKYGETVEEILEYSRDVEQKLETLIRYEERSDELIREIQNVEERVLTKARQLSELRHRGAKAFSEAVRKEMQDLGMPNALFEVAIENTELSETGLDKVEFLISTNPGEPLRPLAKVASGGEMSRIMLAIKCVMAETDSIPTLIFDEIDVGVGGRTAEVVARKLDSLAKNAQVLCITHLPQIASCPGSHFCIEKHVSGGRTVVRVRRLNEAQRVEELARMLGGSSPSETAIRHAKEMLGVVG
jgi:DNA repair protein RecN (Recombination protein N)